MQDRSPAPARAGTMLGPDGGAATADERYGIGRAATPEEIAGWNIDVAPDGVGLPPGHGDVSEGEAIYDEKCAGCHGAHGEGKPMDRLVGGFGTVFE